MKVKAPGSGEAFTLFWCQNIHLGSPF